MKQGLPQNQHDFHWNKCVRPSHLHPALSQNKPWEILLLFCFFFFLPFLIVFCRNLCVLIQQGVRHQFEGPLSVGDNLLHRLQLFLHRVDGGVFSHDVPIVGRVWPTHTRLERKKIKLMIRLNINAQDTQQKNCNKDLPTEGALACLGGSSGVEEPFYVSVLPSIFAPPLSSSSTCLLRISWTRQAILMPLWYLLSRLMRRFGLDLISMCQRCSSSLCLFSTAFCFCFFSLFSCSFLTRLLGLISTGSSGFTFFYRDRIFFKLRKSRE